MRGDRLQEVSNIVIWLGKFWYFGKLVAEDRWPLTKGVRNWRFHCTRLVMLVQRTWLYIKTPGWQVSTFSPSIYSRHENFDLQLLSEPVHGHFSLQLLPLKYYLPNRHDDGFLSPSWIYHMLLSEYQTSVVCNIQLMWWPIWRSEESREYSMIRS